MAEVLIKGSPAPDLDRRGMKVVDGKLVQVQFIDTGLTTPDGVPIYALAVGGSSAAPSYTRLQDGDGLTLADVVASVVYSVDHGVAKGAQTGTTLKDTDKSWGVNALQGMTVTAWTEDESKVESHAVVSNTADTITITGPWANTPVAGTTHYTVKTTGNALVVKGADLTIDAEEINISDVKVGHYKATPPDLADNQDSQVLLDIKGRTIIILTDGTTVAEVDPTLKALKVDVKTALSGYDSGNDRYKFDLEKDSTLPSTVVSGNDNVTTAGTRVQLNAGTPLAVKRGVVILAKGGNTGIIYVGGSNVDSSNGIGLTAGESFSIDIDDIAEVYIDSSVNGEGVKWTGS